MSVSALENNRKYKISKTRVLIVTGEFDNNTSMEHPYGRHIYKTVTGREAEAVRAAFMWTGFFAKMTEEMRTKWDKGEDGVMFIFNYDPKAPIKKIDKNIPDPKPTDAELYVCMTIHAAIRQWCEIHNHARLPEWDDLDNEFIYSTLSGVRFHIANPDATDADSHNNWMATRLADGWVYGEKKCLVEKTHPCLVPFEKLSLDQQVKDGIFRALVHAMKVTVL